MLAKVYDKNGQVIPNVKVKLELSVDVDSEGHYQHGNDRPKGTLISANMMGEAIIGSTGTSGLAFTFSAPAPAGDHKITASCTDGKNCKQEGADGVWVGIKNLVPLPSSDIYVLLPNRDTAHPGNHYMTPLASQRLAVLAALYHGKFPNDPIPHLNDASLERGGLFDINARFGSPWVTPHGTHRYGDIIDIRANSEEGAIPDKNHPAFKDIAKKVGGKVEIHDPNTPNQHFHVKF